METVARFQIDSNRDGVVGDEPGHWDWVWGVDQPGAITLVNCDLSEPSLSSDAELCEVRIVVEEDLPSEFRVGVSIAPNVISKVSLLRESSNHTAEPVAGFLTDPEGANFVSIGEVSRQGETLWLAAHEFPSGAFDGRVELMLVIGDDRQIEVVDRCLIRVAPWVMCDSTRAPKTVYVVNNADPSKHDPTENAEFLSGLGRACEQAGVPLVEIPVAATGGDIWMQDEIEFGYSAGVGRTADIVVDGPRNRGLDDVAETMLASSDLGVYEVRSHLGDRSSLDSFGNLEVSPPVAAGGVDYQLGRIVLGTKRSAAGTFSDRKAALALRQFLYSQRVQSPFEIYTDWLAVGHVDEILCFEPHPGDRSFQILIASPRLARTILREASDGGYGATVCFEGRKRLSSDGSLIAADIPVDDLLQQDALLLFNDECEEHLAEVRTDLQRELGLEDLDFVDIPVLFRPVSDGETQKALAYFPDMVNHLVLGRISVVPKPYGPRIDGKDVFEEAFTRAVPHRTVAFVDDWLSYHELSGEVHCGTNVLRHPPDINWWEHMPPGEYNASLRPQ